MHCLACGLQITSELYSGPPNQGAQEVIDFLGDLLARDLVQVVVDDAS
jgi:hypothetical protein